MTNVTSQDMMQRLFDSDKGEDDVAPFHLITTNHPYMATLGLSQFTTGVLYKWWNLKDGKGEYVNRKHFSVGGDAEGEDGEGEGGGDSPEIILLGSPDARDGFGNKADEGASQFIFYAWRKEGDQGAGTYYPKYIDGGHTEEWDFVQPGSNEAGDPRNYSYSDLAINEFQAGQNGVAADFTVPDGKGKTETVTFEHIDPITKVVALNEYMASKIDTEFSRITWEKKDFARAEFCLDIMTSKGQGGSMGFVEWSGYVPFELNLAEGDDEKATFKCKKPDWVKFKLYLYPPNAPRSTARSLVMSSPTFAGPPVDSLGRKYQYREDGRFSAFPEGSRAAEVAGELDVTFNEYTGKWEAGSKQMVGIVTQRIEKAQVMKAAQMRNLSTEDMLKAPSDPNSHIIWGSGAAMPISQQNANPMQWTPNYAQESEVDSDGRFTPRCPKKTEDKATLVVYNASAKVLEVDQMCLLNQIDGQWFVIDFPSGIEDDTVVAGVDGAFDFQYTATNFIHFFRDKSFLRIDSSDIEKGLHQKFYMDLKDPLNSGRYYSDLKKTVNQSDGPVSYLWKIEEQLNGGGFHQFSSFDYMDRLIGGTREEGNIIGCTNPLVDLNENSIEGDFDGLNTGGFFGCIFPDGYDSEDIAQYRVARNFDVAPAVAASSIQGENSPYGPSRPNSTTLGLDFAYFNAEGIPRAILPFNNSLARHDYTGGPQDETGNPIPVFDDNDTKLTHLPADIALNAAPSGKWGQPIKNVHAIDYIYNNPGSTSKTVEAVGVYFLLGQNWLYKKYDPETAGAPDHIKSSAFNFKPRVPNHIMFRPLKSEAYVDSWPGDPVAGTQNRKGYRRYFSQQISNRSSSGKRGMSSVAQSREYNADYASTTFYNKWSDVFEVDGLLGQVSNIYNSSWGLQLNVDLPPIPTYLFPEFEYKISPRAGFDPGDDSERFPQDIWGIHGYNKWVHGNSKTFDPTNPADAEGAIPYNAGTVPPWAAAATEEEPAGAVGIIGVTCTVFANDTLTFTTDNKIGCWAWGILGAKGDVVKYPSWGKGDGYRDFHTTNLYAKVYHAWPREQTIYDSRYFAIHHFNPGIHDIQNSGYLPSSNKQLNQRNQSQDRNNTQSYWYSIDEAVYDTDTRMPSAKLAVPATFEDPDSSQRTNKLVTLSPGTRVYSTRTYGPQGVLETASKEDWNVDISRRTKILPYTHYRRTLSVPKVAATVPLYTSEEVGGVDKNYENGGYVLFIPQGAQPDQNTGVYELSAQAFYYETQDGDGNAVPNSRTFDVFAEDGIDAVMVVKNPGSNYQVGDTFTVSDRIGADFTIKVLGVTTTADRGQNDTAVGRITQFYVESQGYDFSNSAFSALEKPYPSCDDGNFGGDECNDGTAIAGRLLSKTTTGTSVVNGGGQPTENGQGFSLMLIRGEVVNMLRTDEKPPMATDTETSLLSITSNKNDSTGGESILSPEAGEYFGLDTGSNDVTVPITNQSESKKYDIFLFFHNDISHTHMTQEFGGSVSRPHNDEQYIDLRIGTE